MRARWMTAVGVIAVVLVVLTAWVLLRPSPHTGDEAKLERSFSPDEGQRVESRTVSGEELAAATCGEGLDCWVAVDGVVYDVGGFDGWKDGRHHGIDAGADQTAKFIESEHARKRLEKLPIVGRLGE